MSNPFESTTFMYGEFREHIRQQLIPLELDHCEVVDYGNEPTSKMRMTVCKVGDELNRKFSLKTAEDGKVWVKRIK